MKVLKDSQFDELKRNADAFSAVVAAMVEHGEGITAEEITAETVIQAMQSETPQEVADLQPDLDAAASRIGQLETELNEATTRVAELEQELDITPAAAPATITSTGETTGEKEDILAFAKKNAGDPFVILAEAEKQGYL